MRELQELKMRLFQRVHTAKVFDHLCQNEIIAAAQLGTDHYVATQSQQAYW